MATLSKLQPHLENWAVLDLLITHAYSKKLMGDSDQPQFQADSTNNKHGALQGNNVARNEAIPNREAQTKHPLSTYKNEKKRWLVTAAHKEQCKGTGFILRLKWR